MKDKPTQEESNDIKDVMSELGWGLPPNIIDLLCTEQKKESP